MGCWKRARAAALAALLLVSLWTAACAQVDEPLRCPYTSLWWGDDLEDVLTLEGEPLETYASVYGGDTYVFPREFMGVSGQIKYMFDESENLASLAWMYSDADADAVLAAYAQIYGELEDQLGEFGYANANSTNAGGVWYTQAADILINVVSMQQSTAMQYTYINPDASRRQEGTRE